MKAHEQKLKTMDLSMFQELILQLIPMTSSKLFSCSCFCYIYSQLCICLFCFTNTRPFGLDPLFTLWPIVKKLQVWPPTTNGSIDVMECVSVDNTQTLWPFLSGLFVWFLVIRQERRATQLLHRRVPLLFSCGISSMQFLSIHGQGCIHNRPVSSIPLSSLHSPTSWSLRIKTTSRECICCVYCLIASVFNYCLLCSLVYPHNTNSILNLSFSFFSLWPPWKEWSGFMMIFIKHSPHVSISAPWSSISTINRHHYVF